MMSVVSTPRGRLAGFSTREGTNDHNLALGVNELDEYRMKGRALSGWAIDIGAHIGAWAIPAALDFPDLRIIAVEAVPENAAILAENVAQNHLEDRVSVVSGFAAAPGTSEGVIRYGYRHDPSAADGYVSSHRFVGNTWGEGGGDPEFTLSCPAVTLDALTADIDDVAIMKIDCEGCEWAFLDTPAVSKVRVIVGEYHARDHEPIGRLRELLPDHDVTPWSDNPVNGLFEAVRR